MNNSYDLVPLKNAILDIYRMFSEICERHGLQYFVAFGTALGAVRHKGFIPWDDDFDIMMPRPDYEKFVRILPSEEYKFLKFINWKNTPEFAMYSFGKLQDTRHDVVCRVFEQASRPVGFGLFIDIFPVDGYPNGRIGKFGVVLRHKLLVLWLWSGVRLGKFKRYQRFFPTSNMMRQIAARIIRALLMVFWHDVKNEQDIARYIDSLGKRFPYSSDANTTCSSRTAPEGMCRVYEPGTFGRGVVVPFENTMVKIPERCDKYLELIYGDYMEMPPLECRVPGHVLEEDCPWVYGPTTDELPY